MPKRRLLGKTKHYKRGMNAKTPQERMIDRLFRECETPEMLGNQVCGNLGALIQKGDELAIQHHDEGMLMNNNPIEDEIIKNGELIAIFTNPDSQEYCFQSLTLRESNGFPPQFAPILKLRLTEDTYLCRPVQGRDWTDYKSLPPPPTDAQVLADILNLMKIKLEVNNHGHSIHKIHAVMKELLEWQAANHEPVSFVAAAALIELAVIQKKTVTTQQQVILDGLSGIPKKLILIATEKQRLAYADQLISHLDYSVILTMVGRTSLPQVANMVATILTRDKALFGEKIHFTGIYPDKQFEELSADDLETFHYLVKKKEFTIAEAVDFINSYSLPTLDQDAGAFLHVAEKIRNCQAENAAEIMSEIFRSGTRIPNNLQIGACANATLTFPYDMISANHQIEMNHARIFSPGMHATYHELESMNSAVLVAAATMSILGTIAVGRLLWNTINIFKPIKAMAKHLFFSKPKAAPLQSIAVDMSKGGVKVIPLARKANNTTTIETATPHTIKINSDTKGTRITIFTPNKPTPGSNRPAVSNKSRPTHK